MPGRYRFPRPSMRLRQTRLEPRERQQKPGSHDLPVNRRSITPRALTWKSRQRPSSRASTLLTGYFPYL
jgi:hypothetical protein